MTDANGQVMTATRTSTGAGTGAAARAGDDFDAIVIGGGHNGLVTAAYLARAGVRTVVLEARADVGGTAASEQFAGATVNICSCDHLTFRTTPVMAELDLAAHGLRYFDLDPAQHNMTWATAGDGVAWSHHHDLDETVASIAEVLPDQADGLPPVRPARRCPRSA